MDFGKKIKSKIFSSNTIVEQYKNWKSLGNNVVFTNGCFDVLHYGHFYYLAKARNLGDKLIVAINSDNSVKAIKGENRPINNESQRAFALASLECVDAVCIFEETTPKRIIGEIIPDILVKGGDYNVKDIVGADLVYANGGRVEVIDFVDGFSTTRLIKKIKE